MKIIYFVLLFVAATSFAATTIDPAQNDAYGANVGWVNASVDTANGAVIGEFYCSGYLYSANCGWIRIGDGTPFGEHYSNTSRYDCGINHDGQGHLYGYAYGANVGWINFEQTHGKPRVNLRTGELSGYAWGANVGWINLAGLRTLVLDPGGDKDADGIPDGWEYRFTPYGKTALDVLSDTGDHDGDGVSDLDEYLADTDPLSDTEYPMVIDFLVMGTMNQMTWPVKATRRYTLEHTVSLSNDTEWVMDANFIPGSGGDWVETIPDVSDESRFYRIKAMPPLSE